jgi:NAD(P)-dependent dehydrogenase (short-subunit alcohol dehydrogenase family)
MNNSSVVLVTGASSGLGLEIVQRIAASGRCVVGVSRHQPSDERVLALQKSGLLHYFVGDISREADVRQAVAQATSLGNYNVLINCAGQAVFGPCEAYSAEDVGTVFAANLCGLILCCVNSLKRFQSMGGTVINIMSTAAHVGRANETVYCAAKWGARGYTEALRIELKGKPVRVIAVYPGGMKTNFWKTAKGHNVNPDKFMDPSEVADEIVALLSQKKTIQVTDITINRS